MSDPAAAEVDLAFAEFWNIHPRPGDRDACLKHSRDAVLAGEDAGLIVSAARRYSVEQKDNRSAYICRSDNWLREGRWREEPVQVEPDGVLPHATAVDQSGAAPESELELFAAKIRSGACVAPIALTPSDAREMIRCGMVTSDDLRRIGVYA